MPVIPRQLIGELSRAIESRLSTASVALVGPTSQPVQPATTTSTQGALLPSIPVVPGLTSAVNSVIQPASTTSIVSTTLLPLTTTSAAPTTTSVASTTLVATSSSEIVSTSTPLTSALLSLTTPAVSETPRVIASTSAVVVSASASPSATATGLPSNAGSSTQDSNMSGGIIALIVIGALLAALLAGAFAFRRIQVRRRAKRRENTYGAAIPDNAPFPFTNVSEADLKGAQSIRDPVANYNEKPLPSIVPDVYPAPPNPTYNQYGQYGDNGMSGPYPTMGAATMGYGYGQPGRASPAPSQIQAPRMTSPSPPPVAYNPGPSAYPNPYPKALTPAPAPTPAPSALAASSLAVPQAGGKKRVIQTFQPTLPDELDIRDGDWVTVLHTYDDGWGLCECNGRRGVVPLECLDPGRPDFRASRRFSSLSAIRQ